MTDVPANASDSVSDDGPSARPAPVGVRLLAAVQLYAVAAYVAAAVVPYLWRHQPDPPTWTWIVPGVLLGVPGFWITVLGPRLAVPLALVGAGVYARYRHRMPSRPRRWLAAATALVTAYALFSLTPLGHTVAIFTAD